MQIQKGMEHCADVFAGVYDAPIEFDGPVDILDIGANVGAFALWAVGRWNVGLIHCYEPFYANHAQLVVNTMGDRRILPVNSGVGGMARAAIMHAGRNNCGEASVHDIGEQDMESDAVKVNITDAASLPDARILKVDTEGCEVEILSRLMAVGRLDGFALILVEYHSEHDRRTIDALLSGFALIGSYSRRLDRGVCRYVNGRIIQKPDSLTNPT